MIIFVAGKLLWDFGNSYISGHLILGVWKGHENAQQALTSLLYLLARHQVWPMVVCSMRHSLLIHSSRSKDVQEKASLEVANYSVRETSQKLPYLQQILKETLRLCPPIPMLINRRTARNVNLGRFVIPSGTYVGWHAFGVHHSQSVWPDAEEFRPERFHSASTVNRFEWVPFSEGQRRCKLHKSRPKSDMTGSSLFFSRSRRKTCADRNADCCCGVARAIPLGTASKC